MELQRREFLKLVGTAAVVSSAFGVVHAASASRQAVTSSSERVMLVVCNASRYITMSNEETQPKFFVVVGHEAVVRVGLCRGSADSRRRAGVDRLCGQIGGGDTMGGS